jgi:hypothetical protein
MFIEANLFIFVFNRQDLFQISKTAWLTWERYDEDQLEEDERQKSSVLCFELFSSKIFIIPK